MSPDPCLPRNVVISRDELEGFHQAPRRAFWIGFSAGALVALFAAFVVVPWILAYP